MIALQRPAAAVIFTFKEQLPMAVHCLQSPTAACLACTLLEHPMRLTPQLQRAIIGTSST